MAHGTIAEEVCYRGTTMRKYQTCRRRNPKNNKWEWGRTEKLCWPDNLWPACTGANNVLPQTSHNHDDLATLSIFWYLILSLVDEVHAACSSSPHNVLHSPSTRNMVCMYRSWRLVHKSSYSRHEQNKRVNYKDWHTHLIIMGLMCSLSHLLSLVLQLWTRTYVKGSRSTMLYSNYVYAGPKLTWI